MLRFYYLASELYINCCSYEPGPAFEEVKEEPMLVISPTDSTEFWLIQWPKDQLDVSDFHGKELSLQLHKDGNLGNLESSSGKSYELVSYEAQQPDVMVFQPSGSEIKPGMVEFNLLL